MRQLLVVLSLLGALCATATAIASSGPPAPPPRTDSVWGVVPSQLAGQYGYGSNQLTYHGGPVMHTNRTYAIYWQPSGYSTSAAYQAVINGYFANVALDSARSSNVYFSTTQYYDNAGGKLLYSSSFGGAYVDTAPFPANGCRDFYTQVCLGDGQIQAEVNKVVAARGWPRGLGNVFFVFTPKNVGSCMRGSYSCAYSYFCAYHSSFGSGSSLTLYADQPYATYVAGACDSKQHPNGDDADATVNLISHEHAETITDPQGNAWYDSYGNENGDKCVWTFGTSLGRTAFGSYNQVIGAGKYYLQREWSNSQSGCVLTGL